MFKRRRRGGLKRYGFKSHFKARRGLARRSRRLPHYGSSRGGIRL